MMIPYDVDPSLHAGEPLPEQLGDGFSPPPVEPPADVAPDPHAEPVLSDVSPF
jgi:hypothetical protein